MRDDEIPMTCSGGRYCLNYLHVLHEKMLSRENAHTQIFVSWHQTKLSNENPKTCLCQIFLNPRLNEDTLRNDHKPLFLETGKLCMMTTGQRLMGKRLRCSKGRFNLFIRAKIKKNQRNVCLPHTSRKLNIAPVNYLQLI